MSELSKKSAEQDSLGVRFSIVITCYNQREFIKDAVESVLSQRQASKQVIVVDDGSQDGSLEILKRYENSVDLLALPKNCGAIEARNRGAAVAKGEYLIFLDGDDLFTPCALDVYEQLIRERRPTTIVSGARSFSGPVPAFRQDAPKRVEFVEYESLMARDRQTGWFLGAFVICRRAFRDVGGWTREIFHLDLFDLVAKLGYSGNSILVCSPYTMLYRMHAANTIRFLPPFLESAHLLIDKERAGQYPGGRRKRFERYAFLGGPILYWTRGGLRAHLNRASLQLAVRAWTMILASILRRSIFRLRGRHRVEIRQLELLGPQPSHPSRLIVLRAEAANTEQRRRLSEEFGT